MDETEEEKVQLLESLRLQDAALSTTVDNSIVTLESESGSEDDEGSSVTADAQPQAGQRSVREDANPPQKIKSIPVEEETDDGDERQVVDREGSWADALEANQEYDAVLAQLETEIKLNLAKVLKQLDEVQNKISSVAGANPSVNIKSHWVYVFGMPYFKTATFYPCPFNVDYHNKMKENEICWSDLPNFYQWIARHKKVLNSAVRKLSLDKCVAEAQLKRAVLRKELDAAIEEGVKDKVTELTKEIGKFDVDAVAQEMVDDDVANGEHDWMQISAKYFDGKHSPDSCRSFWYMYLHPNINKAPYTDEEENKLISLAEKYQHQDWDRIAEELGTGRSGYQCFIVFQNKLNVSVKRNTWNASEDQKLLETIQKFRIGDYIPWGRIAYEMEGRTKTQVFNRWTYSVNPAIRKGRFTQEEDIMILAGVQMWGEDFQRIAYFLRDRTTCQVRDRYKHYLNRPGLGVPWTIADDELLLTLASKVGRDWAKISERFPTKNRTQVRHRYSTLAKWREKNPLAPLCDAPSRCYNPQRYKDFQVQWENARKILNCGTVEEMVIAKKNLVSSIIRKRNRVSDPVKKKKVSPIETDLVNYFRCSYELPDPRRKLQLKTGEAEKYAEELDFLLPVMKANLNLPSLEEIEEDPSLSNADREILKKYLLRKDLITSPSQTPQFEMLEVEDSEMNSPAPPLFCDVKPCLPLIPDLPADIDYTPTHDLASLYVKLPLMNFDQDQVVADRNQDPLFFEPPIEVPSHSDDGGLETQPGAKQWYAFPPNLTTLVGLRTYLLNRRNLLAWSNEKLTEEVIYDDEKLSAAQNKFDERLMSLFLWPALMSRFGPSSHEAIFLEEEEISKPQNRSQSNDLRFEQSQNYMPMAKESLAAQHSKLERTSNSFIIKTTEMKPLRTSVVPSTSKSPAVPSTSKSPAIPSTSKSPAIPSTSRSSEVRSTSKLTKAPSTSRPPRARNSTGPPKPKRRKLDVEEEDSDDPDDPDDPNYM